VIQRAAIVTGGTRGLGAHLTERLIGDGVAVTAVYRTDASAARRVQERLATVGDIDTVQADLTEPDACHAIVDRVLERHGRVDYLVNNAGRMSEHRVAELSPSAWTASLDVNLSAAFYLSQAALEPMVAQRFGRIVNVSSVSAAMGAAFQVDYAAAKAGLIGLTRSLARVVARKGVTVNCVLPGGFATDLLGDMTITDRDRVEQSVPVGRFGEVGELTHMLVALLHDDASYVTGAVLAVDGGLSMGL
jgi:NAD(P)-dependent dehydrogenase (short-subunit alcohol dehydrogenase family)